MPKLNQQLQLSDGRKLAYNEYGPLNGKPLFYFHGSPGSRLEAPLYVNEGMLQSLDVRLIAMDRPGMGLSDFQPNRRLLDFPNDLLALADHLGVERFSILAYSLGGPYGFACAFGIPERLHKVGIVSGAALFSISACPTGGVIIVRKGAAKAQSSPVKFTPSRRKFFRDLITPALGTVLYPFSTTDTSATPASGYDASKMIPISPPGSKSIERFSNLCTACNLCISACPTQVLYPSFLNYGLAGIFQPMMNYNASYCNYECPTC